MKKSTAPLADLPSRKTEEKPFYWLTFSTSGIFIILLIGFLRYSEPVLLPASLALLMMLIFQPIVNLICKTRLIPKFAAAFVVVIGISATLGIGIYFLSEPALHYAGQLEKEEVKNRLTTLFSPFKEIHGEIVEVADKVQKISDQPADETPDPEDQGGENLPEVDNARATIEVDSDKEQTQLTTTIKNDPTSKVPRPVKVEIREDPVTAIYGKLSNFGSNVIATAVLLLFLLTYGQKMAQRLGEARGTPDLLIAVQQDVSGYLFTISTINLILGAAIGVGLWIIGIPNALLWGVMAAFLNFIPYAGAILGTIIIVVVSALDSSSPGTIFAAGALYFSLSSIEGNIITPSIIGNRFEINPIIVFLWVLAWASIWGIPGMIIAPPLLMAFRILCSRVPSLARVERAITL